MKMEQTECSETSAYKIQTPVNYPEESTQHSEHGESLKSRILRTALPAHTWNMHSPYPIRFVESPNNIQWPQHFMILIIAKFLQPLFLHFLGPNALLSNICILRLMYQTSFHIQTLKHAILAFLDFNRYFSGQQRRTLVSGPNVARSILTEVRH